MSTEATVAEETGPPSLRSANLHHVGIDVENLTSQTRFYCDAFGLGVMYEGALPEYRFTLVLLTSPAGWAIELFKRDGAAPRPVPEDADTQHDILGIGHMCFKVDDLRETHAHLIALGARSLIAPTAAPLPGAGFAYMSDPEGNLIELVTEKWDAA